MSESVADKINKEDLYLFPQLWQVKQDLDYVVHRHTSGEVWRQIWREVLRPIRREIGIRHE